MMIIVSVASVSCTDLISRKVLRQVRLFRFSIWVSSTFSMILVPDLLQKLEPMPTPSPSLVQKRFWFGFSLFSPFIFLLLNWLYTGLAFVNHLCNLRYNLLLKSSVQWQWFFRKSSITETRISRIFWGHQLMRDVVWRWSQQKLYLKKSDDVTLGQCIRLSSSGSFTNTCQSGCWREGKSK